MPRTWLPNPMSEIPTLPSRLGRGLIWIVRLRSGSGPYEIRAATPGSVFSRMASNGSWARSTG